MPRRWTMWSGHSCPLPLTLILYEAWDARMCEPTVEERRFSAAKAVERRKQLQPRLSSRKSKPYRPWNPTLEETKGGAPGSFCVWKGRGQFATAHQ